MAITLIITAAGRAAVINPANTGTLAATITQIGVSPTAVVAAPTAVNLPGEVKRLAGVAGEMIADDMIHVAALDESTDAYTVRSFALYLGDGTLFALYGQPTPILDKSAGSFAALAVDVVLEDISAADIAFGSTEFLFPSATTERKGIVELATLAEAQAGLDALRALSPAHAKAALLTWLIALGGAGSDIDADKVDGHDAAEFLWAELNLADLTDPAEARENLGLGDAVLDTFMTKAANLADLTDAAEARENLGLGAAVTDTFMTKAANLSDLADSKTARANLGLSDAEIFFSGAGF